MSARHEHNVFRPRVSGVTIFLIRPAPANPPGEHGTRRSAVCRQRATDARRHCSLRHSTSIARCQRTLGFRCRREPAGVTLFENHRHDARADSCDRGPPRLSRTPKATTTIPLHYRFERGREFAPCQCGCWSICTAPIQVGPYYQTCRARSWTWLADPARRRPYPSAARTKTWCRFYDMATQQIIPASHDAHRQHTDAHGDDPETINF